MAKRSISKLPDKVIDTVSSDTLDIAQPIPYTTVEQNSKRVVCKFPASIKLVGKVSGKQYEWMGAGSIVEIDLVDVDDILSKTLGNASCCGASQRTNTLFEIV